MINTIKFTQKVAGAKVDGIYGKETASKVSEFLEKHRLAPYVKDNNIVAVRTNDTFSDSFDDLLILRNKQGKIVIVPCSTKAGRYYVENPLLVDGTAVIAEGTYTKSHIAEYTYRFGGKRHIELKQYGAPIRYYRDNNKDDKIDRTNLTAGFVGLNIHVAKSSNVGRWSAGCIVVPEDYWQELEQECFTAEQKYTLHLIRVDVKIPKRIRKKKADENES